MGMMKIIVMASLGLTLLGAAPDGVWAQGATSESVSIIATTGTLKGRVLDDGGKPLAGQSVMFYIMSEPPLEPAVADRGMKSRQPVQQMGRRETDADGAFDLPGAPAPGQVILSVKSEGFAVWTETVTTPNDNLEIRLRRPYTKVSGLVTRLDGGAPVVGAKISLYAERTLRWGSGDSEVFYIPGDRVEAVSNSDGHYETELLPEGQITVDGVAPDGLRPVPVNDKLYTTATLMAGTPLALPDITMYHGYTLKGQVRDAESKAPIAGAEVGFMMGGRRLGGSSDVELVRTDALGNYAIVGANPMPDKKSGALLFLFFQAKADGYQNDIKMPKVNGFDKDHLTVTQDFELKTE